MWQPHKAFCELSSPTAKYFTANQANSLEITNCLLISGYFDSVPSFGFTSLMFFEYQIHCTLTSLWAWHAGDNIGVTQYVITGRSHIYEWLHGWSGDMVDMKVWMFISSITGINLSEDMPSIPPCIHPFSWTFIRLRVVGTVEHIWALMVNLVNLPLHLFS